MDGCKGVGAKVLPREGGGAGGEIEDPTFSIRQYKVQQCYHHMKRGGGFLAMRKMGIGNSIQIANGNSAQGIQYKVAGEAGCSL